jgi:hypothetical protein
MPCGKLLSNYTYVSTHPLSRGKLLPYRRVKSANGLSRWELLSQQRFQHNRTMYNGQLLPDGFILEFSMPRWRLLPHSNYVYTMSRKNI